MPADRRSLAVLVSVFVATISTSLGVATAETAAPLPPAAVKEAGEIFTTRCALCHGASGKGDGTAAAALDPKPQNYGDPTWQASVTDAEIEKIIVGGGTAVGKSVMMPANPDLASKPDVVSALRARIRALGVKPSSPAP